MSSRTIEYERGLAALGASKEPKALGTMSQEEKELLKQRYASMKVLGRYTNPFVEWREQGTSSFYCCLQLISLTGHPPFFVGVHEWFLWKLILTPLSAFLPSEYASLETLKQLTQVVQPSWEVLKGLEEKLTYTWVRLLVSTRDGELIADLSLEPLPLQIGQSTSYVQMSGLRILTDPIFSCATSFSVWFKKSDPFESFALSLDTGIEPSTAWSRDPNACVPHPASSRTLRRMLFLSRTSQSFFKLLLSSRPCLTSRVLSSHFDHLDIHAVKELGNSAKWFVPLGVKPWFEKEGVSNVCELE